ncbi:MAG TPA: hypothetical protein VE567_07040, partial [Sphingomonas sp.]|nr:hypothetical protein [Sphingomonas sp.]
MLSLSLWLRLAAAGLLIAAADPATAQVRTADTASLTARPDGAEVNRGAVRMRVTALTHSILRVRIARDGR